MTDILLTSEGDLNITEDGDIALTESVKQAVKIRLQWFQNEWRFSPEEGIPYFEDILIKSPDISQISRLIRDKVLSIDEVLDVKNIKIAVDRSKRTAKATMDIALDNETYREEVLIHV